MAFSANIRRHAALVISLLISTAFALPASTQDADAAAATTSAPALSPRDEELVGLLTREVAQAVEQMRSGSPQRREQAQRTLAEFHRQLLPPLEAAAAGTLAPADFARLLTRWDHDIAQARIGATLGPDMAEKVRRLRDARPDIATRFFSDDPVSQGVVFRRLLSWPDPHRLVEPLAIQILRDAQQDFDQDVLHPLLSFLSRKDNSHYLTPAVMSALLPLCDGQSLMRRHGDHPHVRGANGTWQLNGYRQQVAALLVQSDDDNLPPLLLAILLECLSHGQLASQCSPLVEGLVHHKAHGAIPVLLEAIDVRVEEIEKRKKEAQQRGEVDDGRVTPDQMITNTALDMLIFAVLRLSDQSLDDYRVKTSRGSMGWQAVVKPKFEIDQDRVDSIAKLRTWWDTDGSRPPYDTAKRVDPAPIPRAKPYENPNGG
ncbi:MAG: hypothetical protein FWE88_02230 [Phycisphaerae bacterium]|nr:hypothetical protein [Phycisphaerae bacterium]